MWERLHLIPNEVTFFAFDIFDLLYLRNFSSVFLLETILGRLIRVVLLPRVVVGEVGIGGRPRRGRCRGGGGRGCRRSRGRCFLLREVHGNLNIAALTLFRLLLK